MSGSSGRLGARVGDAPRVEIALPTDVGSDAFLTNWVKTQPGPVTFDGTPCSFPGRVWKSKKGSYKKMMLQITSSQTTEKDRKDEISAHLGGGTFSKLDRI